ncbi:hypothetical protein BGX28_000100 [Mortierella sp. GBA30]|nr:hypothetical protein BGX28_000100 [Mortierella sp. GBA30]
MSFIRNPSWYKSFITPKRYSHKDIPDLTGKVAIVTGANTGLGYWTTVSLAAHGAHVILACRSEQRAMDAMERAKKDIRERFPQAPAEPKLEFLELDLLDMTKCRRSAQAFLDKGLPLHILVNNSGIMAVPFELSPQGIETQFAVNHMGHFVFTMGLLDKIKESQPSRIVVLSSLGHEFSTPGGIDFDTLNDPSKSDPIARYGRSKLANVLFGKALARRLANERVYVNVVHPGTVSTELGRYAQESYGAAMIAFLKTFTFLTAMTPEVGSLTQLYCATSPEIEEKDIRGRYFIPIANELTPSAYAQDEELQEKLWEFSEKLVKEKLGA